MFKNILKGSSIVLSLVFVIGCASKGVEVRRYVEIKDRVDQTMEGNAGYLTGVPQPEDRSAFRPTRKIYVVEVSQGDVEEETIMEESAVEESRGIDGNSAVIDESDYDESDYDESDNFIEVSRGSVVTSNIDDDTDNFSSSPSFTEYTVKKDDTLQKISKKFYDSFAKWQRIYDANKGVIDDPDRIKPGTVIQIPMD
jgi:nucleoid-associated protein YgaU